jgi:hypothetical protein
VFTSMDGFTCFKKITVKKKEPGADTSKRD